MTKYLIKLKPINNFFFGGDITFGKLGDKENSTYLVKSRYLPQQTTLLGLVRKQILIQKGLLTKKVKGEWVDKSKKQEAIRLVGDDSFSIKESNKKLNFGIINKISPVFLTDDKEYFFVLNDYSEIEFVTDDKDDKNKCFIDGKEISFLPKLISLEKNKNNESEKKNFNSKKGIEQVLISVSNQKIDFKSVFLEVTQIGNNKTLNEDALYKKTSYSLKDNYQFCFILELEEELKLENSIVSLGGDSSNFKMSVEKINETFEEIENKITLIPENAITLFSDAYIKESNILDYCSFAVTNTISFQNLISKHSDDIKKSEKNYFYTRGSVFFEPKEKKLEALLSIENFQRIGYNMFKFKEGKK